MAQHVFHDKGKGWTEMRRCLRADIVFLYDVKESGLFKEDMINCKS